MSTIVFFLAAALVLAPELASGKSICIWQYDSLDRYHESEAETQVGSTWGLEKALTALGHDVQVVDVLPDDLGSFDLISVCLGWSRG